MEIEEICDAMYDVTAQFFPQFLTFKMAEESVAREDVPSNRMLMTEIRSLIMLPVELVFRGIFFLGLCFSD